MYNERGLSQVTHSIYGLVLPRGFFRVENLQWFMILDDLQ